MASNNLDQNAVVNTAVDAGHSLAGWLTTWYHSPELQDQYHGDVVQALHAHGFDTTDPNFVQEFQDASELAIQTPVTFEGSHQTATDIIAGPQTQNVEVNVPSAPVPGLGAAHSAPAPVFVAPESHGDPIAQQLQAISNNYVTYTTEVNTDARSFQNNIDNSRNNTFNTDGGNVRFTDNSETNTNVVNGDNAFGATDVRGDIRGVATGDRAVAAGDDAIGATGDGSIAARHLGVANTGDNAITGERIGAGNTGNFEGTQVGDDVRAPLQTITGDVDGIAANDSHLENVNTGDLDRGSVLNQGIDGDANTLTGGVGAHSNVNLGGDQNVLQGDGNVGSALGEHARSDIDRSSIATNGSEAGPVLDASDGGNIAFGSGAQAANANFGGGQGGPTNFNQFGQQAVSEHGDAQVAGRDLVNQTADGARGPVSFGSGDAIDASHNDGALSFGGDATNAAHGGIANHVGGDQAFAQDHSAASVHGDATAQNVDHVYDSAVSFDGDAQNFSHTTSTAGAIDGNALNQDHNHDTAGVAGHGDATVDNSYEDNSWTDNSWTDNSSYDDHSDHSWNDNSTYEDNSENIHHSYNDEHYDAH